jgi:hypothetical protein
MDRHTLYGYSVVIIFTKPDQQDRGRGKKWLKGPQLHTANATTPFPQRYPPPTTTIHPQILHSEVWALIVRTRWATSLAMSRQANLGR